MAGKSRLDNYRFARLLTRTMRGTIRPLTLAVFSLCLLVGGVEGQVQKKQSAQNPLKTVSRTVTRSPAKKKAAPPKPLEMVSRALLAGRDSLVQIARRQLGIRYRLGASQPGRAFDCSSLVQWITGLFGGKLPRTAAQQAQVGIGIPKDTSHLLPGDLLYFGRGKKVTHIGIYVGDGKYLHASSTKKRVVETELRRTSPSFWKGVRRVFLDVDSLFAWQRPESLAAHGLSGYKFSMPKITNIAIVDLPPTKQQGTH